MAGNERFDDSIGTWLQETAPDGLPQRVLAATFERTRRSRQDHGWRAIQKRLETPGLLPSLGGAVVIVVAAFLAVNLGVIPGPGATPPPPSPSARATIAPSMQQSPFAAGSCRRPETGTLLDCSRDGTLLLIQKDQENLFLVHADGSQTRVTDKLSGISRFVGSARPNGATISPDGSRVVFAGLSTMDGGSCHHGALFSVDADGGPAELIWESQAAIDGGIVRYPTFSPDGTRIAFADGYCDSNHRVWVMHADGTNAHPIVTPANALPGSDADVWGVWLGAAHVYGLAWSPAGDRIAVRLEAAVYSFSPDGADPSQVPWGISYCWEGSQC